MASLVAYIINKTSSAFALNVLFCIQKSLFKIVLVHLAHDANDAARDGEILAVVYDNRAIFGICRTKFDVVGCRMVILDGSFVINLGYNDFALFCIFLLAGENEVSIENACVNHGIAFDAKSENIAAACKKITVDGNCTFEILDCKNGLACGNTTDDWNFNGVAWCLGFVLLGF